jgi:hypothetical protein
LATPWCPSFHLGSHFEFSYNYNLPLSRIIPRQTHIKSRFFIKYSYL